MWTNSGDSHFIEPHDGWTARLPRALADPTPKAVKDPDGEWETVSVDGQTFRRKLPSSAAAKFIEDSQRQVYAFFQHDETAAPTMQALGYRNVMFGSDYPHMEGTFGHTQKTLEGLLADAKPETVLRITQGTFRELFPQVPPVPASTDAIEG